ncbi:MAG: GNAT family N-acetyltransferase [Bacillales bacterium]|nr:GNAT family N-acetyltransferase [Bacillales bacterium]
MKKIETDRLIIRDVEVTDSDFILKLFSHPLVTKNLFNNEPMSSIDEAKILIDFYLQKEPSNQHRWIIFSKEINRRIGTFGYHSYKRDKKTVRIGFDLYPKHWKNGYMTEALPVLIDHIKNKLDVDRIEARIYPENIDAIKVVEKLGFVDSNEKIEYDRDGEKYIHHIYVLNVR